MATRTRHGGGRGAAGAESTGDPGAGAAAGTIPADALGAIMSPKQVAQFSALLWAFGCVIGVLAIVLPHGSGVNVVGWAALTAFAGSVAIWTLWKAVDQPLWVQYILSLLALVAISGAVLCGHRSPVVYAVAGLYSLSSIYTASFYSGRAFSVYLVGQAIMSGLALLTTGIPGAGAGWAVLVGTTTTVGVVVHVMQQALRVAATTDPLTGLVNRRALEPTVVRELARCRRLGHPLCLAVMDLDHFKAVNDEHGHQAGDRLLADVSRAWTHELRATDVLSRSGGDEFVLMLPSTEPDEAVAVLARLFRATPQGFSAGDAAAEPECTVEDVLRRADAACYRATQTGGGNVVVAGQLAA
ncbi:MAG TPA: GGDEF domain-containing protein [Acidimicrobiales bacterium]|nr:GGDEF domain-containing protein [Acidimicrobiales bacterium]